MRSAFSIVLSFLFSSLIATHSNATCPEGVAVRKSVQGMVIPAFDIASDKEAHLTPADLCASKVASLTSEYAVLSVGERQFEIGREYLDDGLDKAIVGIREGAPIVNYDGELGAPAAVRSKPSASRAFEVVAETGQPSGRWLVFSAGNTKFFAVRLLDADVTPLCTSGGGANSSNKTGPVIVETGSGSGARRCQDISTLAFP